MFFKRTNKICLRIRTYDNGQSVQPLLLSAISQAPESFLFFLEQEEKDSVQFLRFHHPVEFLGHRMDSCKGASFKNTSFHELVSENGRIRGTPCSKERSVPVVHSRVPVLPGAFPFFIDRSVSVPVRPAGPQTPGTASGGKKSNMLFTSTIS